MGNTTSKEIGKIDGDQALRKAYNVEDASLTVSSFISAKVGHKVTRNVISSTVDQYEFYDQTTLLYTLQVTYSNADHDDVNEVERIS